VPDFRHDRRLSSDERIAIRRISSCTAHPVRGNETRTMVSWREVIASGANERQSRGDSSRGEPDRGGDANIAINFIQTQCMELGGLWPNSRAGLPAAFVRLEYGARSSTSNIYERSEIE
jgi:hypothetical protein